jgi:sodium/potassium-transporting ATPase subunit alpha
MREIHAGDVVPGDLLLVGEGDRIPADARLVGATFLKVNNAPLTGESEPQVRVSDADEGHTLFEARNIVFAGTAVFSGSG